MSEPTTAAAGADAPARPPRLWVLSWALWDWATQPFNTVIITFVFVALYLASDSFIDPALAALGEGDEYDAAIDDLTFKIGLATTLAGVLVALLAPAIGQRADASGRRKRWLAISTVIMILAMFSLFFVEADPRYFWMGAAIIAVGAVFNEIGGVNYNAMIAQVSTPKSVGKVSGLGWGFGYLGGIVGLILVVVATELELLPTENGMAFRLIAVGAAVWTILFSWPVFAFVPDTQGDSSRETGSFLSAYVVLWQDIKALWSTSRQTFKFLLASAIFRDGLAGIFAFGAIVAAVSFKFTDTEVIMFGIGANLIAGVSTIIAGLFDDKFGPRAVILASLVGILTAGVAVVVFQDMGKAIFWSAGLALTAFVGPAQAASRSFLARIAPVGHEAELFGLYATTGRAASFLAPAMWSLFVAALGATIWGVAGILLVVAVGLALMFWVRPVKGHARL